MSETLLIVFIAIAALAIVLQAAILFALYQTGKKTSERVEALAQRFEQEAVPALSSARELLAENGPKIRDILTNLSETTTILREKAAAASATADVAIDRARQQVLRADELATRTLDRVESTTDAIHSIVNAPIRQVSAIVTGLFAGLTEFAGGRKVRRAVSAVPKEEMFI
jgi:methyl-accepting chemotaxis protein